MENKALVSLASTLRLDQIAFYVWDDEGEQKVKDMFGLQDAEWVEDHVVAEGRVMNGRELVQGQNTAKLLFNYDLGIELEILRYVDGDNYCNHLGLANGQICHVGMHTDKGAPLYDEDELENMFPYAKVIQQVHTLTHTNEYVNSQNRKYRYTIYDSHPLLGCCLKVIERIEAEDG